MDLTFQVPIQYCSWQHRILLSSPHTSTTKHHLLWPRRFILSGAISSSSPLFPSSMLDTFRPGTLIFQYHVFLSFYIVHEVLTASILGGLPFPPPVDHILSELSTMTHPSWVALHGMAHSSIELYKPLCQDKTVICEGARRTYTWLILGLKFPVLEGLHKKMI